MPDASELLALKAQLAQERQAAEALEARLVNHGAKDGRRLSEVRHEESSSLNADAPDDLTQCGQSLDNVGLAAMIKSRYEEDKIYTYIGGILLAVNPFKRLPIYGPNVSVNYIALKDKSTQAPHIYYIADAAYRAMLLTKKGQVCVISGESGAGKTESSKYLIQQILDCSGHHSTGAANIDADRVRHPVEERIMDINPILEAFGNAQTVMNDNSSRFGKYIELQFQDETGSVLGASLSHYLLEKSRVVVQGEGELNFRVFASLFAGGEKKIMSYYRLRDYSSHKYLPEGVNIDDPAFGEEWRSVQQALYSIGFKDAERDDIVAALAGILHMGDLVLQDEGADGSTVASSSNGKLVATTDALLVDDDELVRALCTGELIIRGEVTTTVNNVQKAADTRDGAAKAIYDRLFSWLVSRIDAVLAANPSGLTGNEAESSPAAPTSAELNLLTCGILDIFGFEDFDANGFDQFCINLANERLQSYFNKNIFQQELEEYKRDGIAAELVDGITFSDNQGTLDLILVRQVGLIPMLNEACKFQTSTGNSLVEKFNSTHKDNASFAASRTQGLFGIKHYAGSVTYSAKNFLEKNRDLLPPLVIGMLSSSGNPLISRLFTEESHIASAGGSSGGGAAAGGNRKSKHGNAVGRTKSKGFFSGLSSRFSKRPGGTKKNGKGGKKPSTAATSFSKSLIKLMDKMEAADPHFVRCIKPNSEKVPEIYDAEMVLRQMRYNGLLATVQIRRQGYPNRLQHSALFNKFQGLVYNYTANLSADQDSSTELLTRLTVLAENMKDRGKFVHSGTLEGWLVGSTKAFLKHWHLDLLIAMQAVHQAAATAIQAKVRMYICRLKYLKTLEKYKDQCALVATFAMGIVQRSAHTFSSLQALADEEARRGPIGLGIIKVEKKKKHKPPPVKIDAKKFEKNLSKARKAAIKWWLKAERPRKFHVESTTGEIHQWFHGLITRGEAEDFLMPCEAGTYLFRVSERYHGYALSVKIGDRIKHYKISMDGRLKVLILDGIDGHFDSLLAITTTYASEALPTLDGTTALLLTPLAVIHDLGLPIDRHDVIVKGAKKASGGDVVGNFDEDDDGFFNGLEPVNDAGRGFAGSAMLDAGGGGGGGGGAGDEDGSSARGGTQKLHPEDVAIFEAPVVQSNGKTPRWLRGNVTREVTVNELADRGMIDGRFVVRQKERKDDFVSFAISYSYVKKFYHHILCRRKGGYWAIDQMLLQFPNGSGRMCSLIEVVEYLQSRQVPQLATVLEQEASLGPAPSITAKPAARGLQIRAGPADLGPAASSGGGNGGEERPRVNSVLALAGLGIGGGGAGTLARRDKSNGEAPPRKRPISAFLGAPPPARASAHFEDDEPIYDTRTGRRVTGIPRVKLNGLSSFDDVCAWLVALGLSHCLKKFGKKKVNGTKLFDMTEKKMRKLVKSEDDFILLKRALRQAKAYAATVVPVIVEEPQDEGVFVQQKGRHGGPFRSVRRENPLNKALAEGNAKKNGKGKRKYQMTPSVEADEANDEYLSL